MLREGHIEFNSAVVKIQAGIFKRLRETKWLASRHFSVATTLSPRQRKI